MPGPRPRQVRLAPPVRAQLTALVRQGKVEHRLVQRARIVLLAAKGMRNTAIASKVGSSVRTVERWRARFADDPRVASLADLPRSGRPSRIPVAVRCFVGMASCAAPESFDLPRTVWSQQALARVTIEQTGCDISRSEVCRTLKTLGLTPHRFRRWVHSPDPQFKQRTKVICDLYRNPPKDATLLCVDEKPGIQALERRFPTRTSLSGAAREEYEYIRHGTQALIAALDVRSGEVLGDVRDHRGGDDLVAFMEQVAQRYPTGRVIIIWDNLNIHFDGPSRRWQRFNERHGHRFEFVYTPKHASWLNQIEIWFSILERQLLRHGSFPSTAELRQRISRFIDHYSQHRAKPFRWTFRGDFGQHRPKVHTSAKVRRCPASEQSPTTQKLSKSNFIDTVTTILKSAAVAQS